MTQRPKRRPGDRNPEVDPTQAHQIQNAASMGASSGDFAALRAWRAVFKAWDWLRHRRRKRKAVAAYEASKRDH
jgi:hypothetical protein